MPKKLIEGRKIKLYEMKTECVDNEDQLFMLDGDEILGPFCQLEYSSRYKRGTSQDSAAHEVHLDLQRDWKIPTRLCNLFILEFFWTKPASTFFNKRVI